MRRGDTFASVETQVIDASGLSDAEKPSPILTSWPRPRPARSFPTERLRLV